jgi:N,N'-diacetyllegionaminate synthase
MKIGNFETDQKVLVIAEIGNNHEGCLEEAKKLVQAAAKSGANAVKFQTIVPEKLVSADQVERLQQLKKYAFSYAQFSDLKLEADRAGVLFLSTPFDLESAEFLNDLVPAFKIASGDSNFHALLHKVVITGKPVIISTGLSDFHEKLSLRNFFISNWRSSGKGVPGLALLHCVTEYPTADARAGLRHLEALKGLNDITVGYSDHTLGIEAAVLSVGMGARIVEKHFTLDKNKTSFRDHGLSADPQDFREMVRRIRLAETLLAPVDSKSPPGFMPAARRSAAANRDLPEGHKIHEEDIIWLRPGSGFGPDSAGWVLSQILKRPVAKGRLFVKEDFRF